MHKGVSRRAVRPAGQGSDDLDVSVGQVFGGLYRFLYNKRVGLILILAMCALSFVGVMIQQMPAGVRDDAEARAGWLDQARGVYGGWTDVLDFVGAFHIFSSPVWLATMALLALSIAACTTHRLPLLWKAAFHPQTHVRPRFFDHARMRASVESPLPPDEAMEAARGLLERRRTRVIVDERSGGRGLYVDQNHLAPFGTVAAHAAFILIMVAFAVSSVAGFREEAFNLTVGVPEEVGHGTGLTARADSFTDAYDQETGSPIDYVSDLTLMRDGEEVARQDVRVNEPLIIDGVYFHQASFGIAAVVDITDEAGKKLFEGGVPMQWATDDGAQQYGVHILEEQQLEIFVISAASGQRVPGLQSGQVRVEVYPLGSETMQDRAVLDPGERTELSGIEIGFDREQKFTTMIVKKDPGAPIMWIGCALLAIGTCLTMFFRHHRIWVRVSESEGGSRIKIASPDQTDAAFRRRFGELADELARVIGHERAAGCEHTADDVTSETAETATVGGNEKKVG